MSNLLRQEACPVCPSSDAFSIYDSGWGKCFSCGRNIKVDDDEQGMSGDKLKQHKGVKKLIEFTPKHLKTRKINEDTCRKYGYGVGKFKNQTVQVAQYRDKDGIPIAQKLRFPDKSFVTLGDFSQATLFGQWSNKEGGKKLVVTEGEIDALTVSQLQDNSWPVVSIPNGAQGAAKSIQNNLEYLESFSQVIFMFDMDEPGQKAARECSALLSPGKAYIASLPAKDPNELLQAGRGQEVIKAMWNAKVYRPDGIVLPNELLNYLQHHEEKPSIPYPWEDINSLTHGLRQGELVTLTAGSGIGKSQFCRQITHSLIKEHQQKVGYIALEENVRKSVLGLLSIELEEALHLKEGVQFDETYNEGRLLAAYQSLFGSSLCYFYDHFGSLNSTNLFSKIRYLARGCGCQWIVLDHISIVISGISDGDERRLLDNVMTQLRAMVEELGIGLILVSHLRRPSQGKGHEQGAEVSLADLRGSAAIAQLSDMVIGLERNQQAVSSNKRNITTVRVLKNRYSGETGIAGHLKYNVDTTIMESVPTPEFDDEGEEGSSDNNDDF